MTIIEGFSYMQELPATCGSYTAALQIVLCMCDI